MILSYIQHQFSVNMLEIPSSVSGYLKVVKRKEGLRLSSLFLNILNTISAGLLRVNNDGIHVFPQHLCHSNLILLLGGLAQVNKTAILQRGQRVSTKVTLWRSSDRGETALYSRSLTTEPGYSLLMLSMISALRCWRLFSCRSILASPSCSITYTTRVNSNGKCAFDGEEQNSRNLCGNDN